MKDFELHIPTKIIFGKNKVQEIGKHAKKYGKKLLMVYGMESIKKYGIYDQVIKSLKKEDLEIIEYPGAKPNPVLTHVYEGISIARKEDVDFILAVGGGSAIDTAKAIAAGVLYNGDVWDFFKGTAEIEKALPVLTVLTIPATGSEMNGGAVITNTKTREKFGFLDEHLCPKVSILDPTITYTITKEYTAYSAVDACSHLLEGYFTHTDGWFPVQDRYVEGLVKTIIESANIIVEKPKDYNGRATFMWASTLAWNGIGTAGIGSAGVPCHMFAHILGAYYDIAHGAALSIVTPAWMKFYLDKKTKRFAQFARNIMGINKENDKDSAIEGIQAFQEWFTKIGSPISFKNAGLPENELESLSDSVLTLAGIWEIKDYSKKSIKDIYKLCL